ncbi:MAG: hypothetical protein ACFFHV_15395 [Promethearchaeota archaeon]
MVSSIYVLLFAGIHFCNLAYKRGTSTEKLLMLGFASFFFGLAFQRIIFYFSDFLVIGSYSGHEYYGDYENTYPPFELMVKLGYISLFIGITAAFFFFERILKKTKYIITAINLISLFIIVILPLDSARPFFYIILGILLVMGLGGVLWFTKNLQKETQAILIPIITGLILMVSGVSLEAAEIKNLKIIHPALPSLFIIVGVLMCLIPTIFNPEKLLKSKKVWEIFITFNITMLFIYVLFLIVYYMFITVLFFAILGIFITSLNCFYSITRIVNISKLPKVLKEILQQKDDDRDYLSAFVKPSHITEEEVTFHKEQKICLVCKAKVSRLNYMCPKCDAIYCFKCAEALSNLENLCWVCNTQIDESKPIKEEVIKEEDITVEDTSGKVHK